MNILIIGTEATEQSLINLCLKSKHLDHIYTASEKPLKEIPNIEYSDFQDLAHKAKTLQTDIVLVANKELIAEGLVDFLKKKRLNVISVNQKWLNLENSRLIAKKLLNYYDIKTPEVLKAPIAFPVIIKTDKPNTTKIAYSMQELIEIKESLNNKKIFLEKHLNGETYYLLSLWDGQTAIHFKPESEFSEVQDYRLDFLKTKINFMLADEKPDFIGFFATKIIWAENDWHVLEFIMHLNKKSDLNSIKPDFLYLLNSAIYQKLNEFKID